MRRRADTLLEKILQMPGADAHPAGEPCKGQGLLDMLLHQPYRLRHARIVHAQSRRGCGKRFVGVEGRLLVAEQPADLERQRITLPLPDYLQHQVHGRERPRCRQTLAVDDETVLDGPHLGIGKREILVVLPVDGRRQSVEQACFRQQPWA